MPLPILTSLSLGLEVNVALLVSKWIQLPSCLCGKGEGKTSWDYLAGETAPVWTVWLSEV